MRPFALLRPLALALTAWLATPAAPGAADLTVFAAASLKGALDKAAQDWTATSGIKVAISYGGTPQLAQQIEQGAPADLFLSASTQWMDRLAEVGAIDPASRMDLWGNTLVLVSARSEGAGTDVSPVVIDGAADLKGLLGGGKLSMALVDSVPAGQYGKQALETLGLWLSVRDAVVQSENVRVALQLVARGEAALGVVYGSDAAAEPAVQVLGTFPADSHRPIVYPGAVIQGAALAGPAGDFLQFLAHQARADFVAQGFTALSP